MACDSVLLEQHVFHVHPDQIWKNKFIDHRSVAAAILGNICTGFIFEKVGPDGAASMI